MKWLTLCSLMLLATGCALFEDEQDISLSEVPPSAMAAAQDAVPGIEIEEAEIETEDGQRVYELSGSANGREYDIEVSGTGEIIEVEEE